MDFFAFASQNARSEFKGATNMTDATLEMFRDIAEQMIGKADWQWIGPHMSQRMLGITRERAEEYAKRHGGKAEQMQGGR